MEKPKVPNWIKTLLKLAGSSLALYLAIVAVDWSLAFQSLSNPKWSWIIGAFFLYLSSQMLSAIRLNVLFKSNGILISQLENIKLYLVGMLYNFLIPGGVGGDGYKTIIIKRATQEKTLDLAKLMVVDRSFGLLGLLFAGAILVSTAPFPTLYIAGGWIFTAFSFGLGLFLIKKFVSRSLKSFWPLSLMSILIQWFQIGSIWCLLAAISEGQAMNFYGLVFLASSLASVFPLSIGGIGIRELAFVYGAKYGMLNEGYAITLSLGFLLMTILVSVAGFPLSISNKNWKISAEREIEGTA